MPFTVVFDFENLEEHLLIGARQAFQEMRQQYANEIPYYYAIQTTAFSLYIGIVMSTKQHLVRTLKQYGRDGNFSDIALQEMLDSADAFYHYERNEDNPHLILASEMMDDYYGQKLRAMEIYPLQSDWMKKELYLQNVFETYEPVDTQILDTYWKVLETLEAEGIFAPKQEEDIFIVGIYFSESGAGL